MKIRELDNNCSPVAIQLITGESDETVLDALRQTDWEPNKGTYQHQAKDALANLGCSVKDVSIRTGRSATWHTREDCWSGSSEVYRYDVMRMTIAEFCKTYNEGVFYVSVGGFNSKGHCLVVQDGIATDPNHKKVSARRRIRSAFQVYGAKGKKPRSFLYPGEDPLVEFYGRSERRPWAAALVREQQAVAYSIRSWKRPVRLSELLTNTSYTKVDAMWDLKRGRLRIIEE